MKKLEKAALLADREAVSIILTSIADDDLLGQMSFKSRLSEIEQRLHELDSIQTTMGEVALLFGGKPTHGSRAIDADFASAVLAHYQDLVAKRIANDEVGRLGSRGPVPFRTETNLAITDVMRGSVGFVLQEFADNESLVETSVKKAIDDVTDILKDTASELIDDFERTVESLDPRLLAALKSFFTALDEQEATVRIVDDVHDESLDAPAIRRARQRVEMTQIEEHDDDTVVGTLLGLFPHSRRFEIELTGTGEIIHGAVAAVVAPKYNELLADRNTVPIGRKWQVKMRIRQIRERNKTPRNVYTLLGLLRELTD
jgi:hypothetical protein